MSSTPWSWKKKLVFAAGAVTAAGVAAFARSQSRTHDESGRLGREIAAAAAAAGIDPSTKIGPPFRRPGSEVMQSAMRLRDIGDDGSPEYDEALLPIRRAAAAALRTGAWQRTADRTFGGWYLDYDREAMLREAEAGATRVRVAPDVARASSPGDGAPARAIPAAALRANPGPLRAWLRGR